MMTVMDDPLVNLALKAHPFFLVYYSILHYYCVNLIKCHQLICRNYCNSQYEIKT